MKESKNLRIFYIFPMLYVLSAYLFPVFFSLSDKLPVFNYLAWAPLFFGILNIVVSVKYCKPEYHEIMLHSMVLVKYSMIPFFVIGSTLTVFSLLLSFIPVPFMIFLGPAMAFICCVIGWVILVFEAPYTISYLRLSQKAGLRPKFMTVLHSIFQFFFFLDVLDVMYLTLKAGKWKKLTITLIVFMIIAVITFLALIFLGIMNLLF